MNTSENKKSPSAPQVDLSYKKYTVFENQFDFSDSNDNVAIVDFLNLARSNLSTDDSRFTNTDEFIHSIVQIISKILSLGYFSKIFLVTKPFSVSKDVSYDSVIKIILWTLTKYTSEWKDKICVVLVNGINVDDREADDRALFILSDQYNKTTNNKVLIISNDNFDNIQNHFTRHVILNFYSNDVNSEDWSETELNIQHRIINKLDLSSDTRSFLVYHPISQNIIKITAKL